MDIRLGQNQSDLHVQLHYSEGTDVRIFNLTTANEIAAVILEAGSKVVNKVVKQPIKQVNCLRLSTTRRKPLMKI